jgi:hypothetical protein
MRGINEANAKPFRPEQIWDLWTNGKYFHTDLDKLEEIESFDSWGEGLLRFNFFEYIANVTREINYLELAVKEAQIAFPTVFQS